MNFLALIVGIGFGAVFHSQVVLLWSAMKEAVTYFIG